MLEAFLDAVELELLLVEEDFFAPPLFLAVADDLRDEELAADFFDEPLFFAEELFEDEDLVDDFVAADFLDGAAFFADDFAADAFFDDEAFADDFFAEDFFEAADFFADGTLPPSLRASDSPMAIACLRLVTLRPDPLLSVPRLNLCISVSTLSCAFFPNLLAIWKISCTKTCASGVPS